VKSMLLILALACSSLGAFAEDWTTTDGMKYQNVKVVKVEDDAVTIIYNNGGALVSLNKLNHALQERFDYDPTKAKTAADARAKADAESAKELQAEMELAAKMKHEQQIKDAQALGQTNAVAK
jgi:hypothetical protein